MTPKIPPMKPPTKWTAECGLSPTRAPDGARYLYDPPRDQLPETLDQHPKDVFVSDLVRGNLYARVEPTLRRKFRRQELVDHFGPIQFNRDNDPRLTRQHLGQPYLDGLGQLMRLNGVTLKGNGPQHIIEGHLDCQKWGYGGIDPEEGGFRKVHPLGSPLKAVHQKVDSEDNENDEEPQYPHRRSDRKHQRETEHTRVPKTEPTEGTLKGQPTIAKIDRTRKRPDSTQSLPVHKRRKMKHGRQPIESDSESEHMQSRKSLSKSESVPMRGTTYATDGTQGLGEHETLQHLKRENLRLRRELLAKEEADLNQAPGEGKMSEKLKESLKQSVTFAYWAAYRTHETCLKLFGDKGTREDQRSLDEAVKAESRETDERLADLLKSQSNEL